MVMVCKAGERPRSSVWPISVCQPLPTIPIPLLPPDPPVPLDIRTGPPHCLRAGALRPESGLS